jgi:nitroreductase
METLKTIFERRSVRQYTGDPVEREQLETLVKAGMAAPSSRDTRHFYFVIVDDPELIDQLNEKLPYSKMLASARHAIVVISDLKVAHGGAETDYWAQDCAAASQNILLAAKDLGLGACWTGTHPREARVQVVRELLSLPDHVRPLCVIAVGKPTDTVEPRDKFDQTHVFWNQWQKEA